MVQTVKLLALTALLTIGANAQAVTPSCSISANPQSVPGQGQVTITWSTTNAVICSASGAWSGFKDCAGGTATATVDSTRTYTLTVRSATGRASLSWTKPTQNVDGTPMVVGGYRVYIADTVAGVYLATPINLGSTVQSYVADLPPGTYYFGVKAVRAGDGVEGVGSNKVQYNIVADSAQCSTTVSVTSVPKAPVLSIAALMRRLFGSDS